MSGRGKARPARIYTAAARLPANMLGPFYSKVHITRRKTSACYRLQRIILMLLHLKLLVFCTVVWSTLVGTNGDKYTSFTQLAADHACRGERVVFSASPVPAVGTADVCKNGMFASGSSTPFLSSQVCDYRVLVYLTNRYYSPCPYCDPNSKKWLVAIHGGRIDKGTSVLTSFLTQCMVPCANAYIFEDCPMGGATMPGGTGCFTPTTVFNNLHITQQHFDDSYLQTTVKAPGNWVVWLHNYYEPNYALWASTASDRATYICVSGSDPFFAAKFTEMKLTVETPLPIRTSPTPVGPNAPGRLQQALGFNQPIRLIDARSVPDGTASPCSGIFKGGGGASTMVIEFPRALNAAIAADIQKPGGPGSSAGILCHMMRVALGDGPPTTTPGGGGGMWAG